MSNKVFVGGLSWNTTEDSLRQVMDRFGGIEELKIVTDRETGRSRGFGFVSFADKAAAQACIAEINGTELDGRTIKVSEAEDKPRNNDRGGGGHRGDYGGGGGGRGGGGGGRGGRGGGGGGRDRW